MPVNECIPYFEPNDRPTGYCVTAVTGKRFVKVSASPAGGFSGTENVQVSAIAAVTDISYAVAGYDQPIGGQCPLIRGDMSVPCTAGAAITAGTRLAVDSVGRVIPYVAGANPGADPTIVGIALEDQAVVGNDVAVSLLI
jgi:hypothetical protein